MWNDPLHLPKSHLHHLTLINYQLLGIPYCCYAYKQEMLVSFKHDAKADISQKTHFMLQLLSFEVLGLREFNLRQFQLNSLSQVCLWPGWLRIFRHVSFDEISPFLSFLKTYFALKCFVPNNLYESAPRSDVTTFRIHFNLVVTWFSLIGMWPSVNNHCRCCSKPRLCWPTHPNHRLL